MRIKSRSAVRVERMLEEAKRLFAERGFHGTSTRDIVSSAGLNVVDVHYHIGGRLDLYHGGNPSGGFMHDYLADTHGLNTAGAWPQNGRKQSPGVGG